MSNHKFHCSSCSRSSESSPTLLECDKCGSPLNISYIAKPASDLHPNGWSGHPISLPLNRQKELITLGEGNTPVVQLNNLKNRIGAEIYVKQEYMNPTGSFKDRGTSIMISALKALGINELVEDSSGNAGASLSAYAAMSNMKAHIFVPESAPAPKIGQIQVYGATIHKISGSRDATTEAAKVFVRNNNLVYASHNLSPFFIEGTKIFAHEVFREFGDNIPEDIVIPVGNGSLYLGMWKGLCELKESNLISRIPRLHFVQTEAVKPIYSAANSLAWDTSMICETRSGGTAVGSPPRQDQVIDALTGSKGSCTTVTEKELIDWQKILASKEGIYAEPTSATALAGTEKLIRSGDIGKNSRILVPITGSGLKDDQPN